MKICPECNKREIGDRAAMCAPCSRRLNRKYYISIGLCPRCKKNRLYDGEKVCFECKADNAERMLKYKWDNIEKMRAQNLELNKRKYKERRESGICVRCGRRKVKNKNASCEICRIAENNKRVVEIPRSERFAYGLCYRCGDPLDRDGRSCTKCRDLCAKLIEQNKPKKGEGWSKTNDIFFKGGECMRLVDADVIKEIFDPNTSQGEVMIAIVENLPTVEAQPVVHGEWVMIKDMRANANAIGCSICGSMEYVRNDALLNITSVNMNNFCPNCGADMRKKV